MMGLYDTEEEDQTSDKHTVLVSEWIHSCISQALSKLRGEKKE